MGVEYSGRYKSRVLPLAVFTDFTDSVKVYAATMRTLLLLLFIAVLAAEETVVFFTYSNDYFGFKSQDDARTSEMSIRVKANDLVFDIEHSMLTQRDANTRIDEATGKVGWQLDDVLVGIGIRVRGDEAGQRAQNFVHKNINQQLENLKYDDDETALFGWWEIDKTFGVARLKTSADVSHLHFDADVLGGLSFKSDNFGLAVLAGYEIYPNSFKSETLKYIAKGEEGWVSEVVVSAYICDFKVRTNWDTEISYGTFTFTYNF